MNLELLQQAVDNALDKMPFDLIAYKYDISPPTLRAALNGKGKMISRTKKALSELIRDFS